jgi:mono/diheme cytochrome c family protein
MFGRASAAALLLSVGACSTPELATVQAGAAAVGAGPCPQPRTTARAPDSYYSRVNPLPATTENLARGRMLYERDARPERCIDCHGVKGDGRGEHRAALSPPPRDFTCAATMAGLPDGQLFWVIENGAGENHSSSTQGAQAIERPGRGEPFTVMRSYRNDLTPTETWQLVLYLRTFSDAHSGASVTR